MSRARTGLAGLAVLAGITLLSGCGGDAQAALAGAAQEVPAAATVTPSAPAPVPSDPVPPAPVPTAPVPTAGAPDLPPVACTASGLRTTAGPAGGAAGHDAVPLRLTNTGSAPCTLTGYPTVHLLATAGRAPVGPAAAPDPGPQQVVVLAPGASATATLSIARAGLYDEATCVPLGADALSVVAPGGGASDTVRLAMAVEACSAGSDAQVSVTAVAAG